MYKHSKYSKYQLVLLTGKQSLKALGHNKRSRVILNYLLLGSVNSMYHYFMCLLYMYYLACKILKKRKSKKYISSFIHGRESKVLVPKVQH